MSALVDMPCSRRRKIGIGLFIFQQTASHSINVGDNPPRFASEIRRLWTLGGLGCVAIASRALIGGFDILRRFTCEISSRRYSCRAMGHAIGGAVRLAARCGQIQKIADVFSYSRA